MGPATASPSEFRRPAKRAREAHPPAAGTRLLKDSGGIREILEALDGRFQLRESEKGSPGRMQLVAG